MGITSSKTPELPKKNTNYHLPQSEYDELEEWNEEFAPFEIKRFSVDKLLQLANKDSLSSESELEERNKFFHEIINEIQEKGFFLLTESETDFQENEQVRKMMKEFLDKPKQEKEKYSVNETYSSSSSSSSSNKEEKMRGGYKEIFFENRDSVRDPEYRDVYQLFMKNQCPNYPSEHFKTAIHRYFERQWMITISILKLIATELNQSTTEIVKFFLPEYERNTNHDNDNDDASKTFNFEDTSIENLVELRKFSENTNLSFFRYHDTQKYKETQKCMVHQDGGLVTLIPKSTEPGLFIYYNDQWLPIERYMNSNDLIVYFGLSMNWISLEKIPSLFHRVVRQPALIRYSWPFELKPNYNALLTSFITDSNNQKIKDPISFRALQQKIEWLRVMMAVERHDGRNFTEEVPPRDLVRPFLTEDTNVDQLNNANNENIIIQSSQIYKCKND